MKDSRHKKTSLLSGLSEAEQIQCIFPGEPDWDSVSDEVLVDLVRAYFGEPSCATLALGYLWRRKHSAARDLALWLLTEENADQWLKESAREHLQESGDD
jgi:hypothetical protein